MQNDPGNPPPWRGPQAWSPPTDAWPPASQYIPQPGPPPAPGPWHGPDGPGGPPPPWPAPQPPPAPRRSRTPWLIAAGVAVAVLALVGGTVFYAERTHTHAQSSGTTLAPEDRVYSVDIDYALPKGPDVQRLTTLNLQPHGDPHLTVDSDKQTTPDTCALAAAATTQSAWHLANYVGGQLFADQNGEDINSMAWVGVATFDTHADALKSLKAVTRAVTACTSFQHGQPPQTWNLSSVPSSPDRITWLNTEQVPGSVWKCGKDYRVVANVAATATVCNHNPADNPTRLVDYVITRIVKPN